MFIPLSIDDFRFLFEHYRFFRSNSDHYTSTFTVNNSKIEAITTWSAELKCFVTFSNDYKRIIGRGYSPYNSEQDFIKRMEKYFLSLQNRGRPKKDNVPICCNIPRYLKEYLDDISAYYGMTQGEFIADCIEFHIAITSDEVMIKGDPEKHTAGGD